MMMVRRVILSKRAEVPHRSTVGPNSGYGM